MDSINKNQPEDTREDLFGPEAVEKIRELVKEDSICFFCTNLSEGDPFSTRPMSVLQIDDQGNFWFFSSVDSHKNSEISQDQAVQLLFQGSKYSDFLSIYGTATITKDRAKIEELWKPMAKVWFTEGKDDPRITVIKVTPTDGYYWDTKNGAAVAMVKRIAGMITGETYDDSQEGTIRVQ